VRRHPFAHAQGLQRAEPILAPDDEVTGACALQPEIAAEPQLDHRLACLDLRERCVDVGRRGVGEPAGELGPSLGDAHGPGHHVTYLGLALGLARWDRELRVIQDLAVELDQERLDAAGIEAGSGRREHALDPGSIARRRDRESHRGLRGGGRLVDVEREVTVGIRRDGAEALRRRTALLRQGVNDHAGNASLTVGYHTPLELHGAYLEPKGPTRSRPMTGGSVPVA